MKPAEEQLSDAVNEELDKSGNSNHIMPNLNRSFHGSTGVTGGRVTSLWFPPVKEREPVRKERKR